MKRAFTLAEVLITLGIIGVVAAITLPSVIANYQKEETVAKLKKTYSVVNQAILQSIVENDDYSNWEKPYDTNTNNAFIGYHTLKGQLFARGEIYVAMVPEQPLVQLFIV